MANEEDSKAGQEGVSECCGQVVFWTGTPRGSKLVLGDFDCYLASASAASPSKQAILFIHDAFGWTLVNSRLAADHLAQVTGCDVYLPEYVVSS